MSGSEGSFGAIPPAPGPGPVAGAARPPGLTIRVRTLAAVAAGIAILVLLAGTYAAGIGPFQRSTSHLSGPVTFSQARSIADPTAQAYASGGWSLFAAGGALLPRAATIPTSAVQGAIPSRFAGCTFSELTTATTLTVPAFHGSASAGTSPDWAMVYRNASEAILVVGVFNGSAEPLAVLSGGTLCSAGVSFLATLSGGIVDSPAVARSVASAGGSAFLAAHPNASVAMTVIGGFSYLGYSLTPTVWWVNYTACGSVASIGHLMATFNATVDAATGQVTSTNTGMMNCTAVPGTGGSGVIVLASTHGPPAASRSANARVRA